MELEKHMTKNQLADYRMMMKEGIEINKEIFCECFGIEDVDAVQCVVVGKPYEGYQRLEIFFARLVDSKVDLFTKAAILNEDWDKYLEKIKNKK